MSFPKSLNIVKLKTIFQIESIETMVVIGKFANFAFD